VVFVLFQAVCLPTLRVAVKSNSLSVNLVVEARVLGTPSPEDVATAENKEKTS
jgi:hypothetical protein